MKVWTAGLLVAVIAGVVLTAGAVGAQEGPELLSVTVTIDIDTIVRGDLGYTEVVRTLTPADLDAEPGWVCTLVGFGDNGKSTHPDTNAFIGSNGDVVIIPDWERAANTRTAATNGTLTLGSTITVAIQVGGDRVASGGLEIQFTCNPPGQPTTTTTPTTVPTPPTPSPTTTTTSVEAAPPPTTAPPATPTTLSEPPVGGVPAGGGACADGSCSSLSPLQTWILIGVVWSLLAGLAWAVIAYQNQVRSDG